MISKQPNEISLFQKSFSGDAILTTGYSDDYILRGRAFQVRRRISIGTATTIKMVLDSSAVPATSTMFILPISFSGTGGPVLLDTYAISTYEGGTAITPAKLNAASSNVAATVVKTGITSTDTAGNDLRQYLAGATGNPQQVNRSGTGSGSSPLVIPPGTKICLQIENQYTEAIVFLFDIVWYEIPASVLPVPTAVYTLSQSTWTPITTAGQNASVCIEYGFNAMIDHSTTGTNGCSKDKARILTKCDTFQEMFYLKASNALDIFYAIAQTNAPEKIAVDIG